MEFQKKNLKHGLGNCESAFFDDLPLMIVTSSPIEGNRADKKSSKPAKNQPCEDNHTWSKLFATYQTTSVKDKQMDKNGYISLEESTTTENMSSSSYQTIAEQKTKILLTPGKRFQVVSSSSRKIHLRNPTPKKSSLYLAASHQCGHNSESEEEDQEESLQTIKNRLKNVDSLSVKDIERYERILQKFVDTNNMSKDVGVKTFSLEDSDLMHFIEKNIGQCNLSPRTVRMLGRQSQEQEKRLIGLAVAKRKSANEIQKRINRQFLETKQQIKSREELELKLVKAAGLRQKATTTSTLFNQAHVAHHRQFVSENRQKDNLLRLQKQIQSEILKNNTQSNKIVKGIWKTFLHEQYNELRKEVRERHLQNAAILKESETNLRRLKNNYEEKLKELKDVVATTADEAGIEKKEVNRELERLQRKMRHQFEAEFQTLLGNIETKGDHKRLIREEKASQLKKQLLKGDYVFEV
ncbi:uncharacterized protein LOC130704248 [Daphnia carinata]|uniref:uncharacterized protein LOC130704248 n=1 Tax=Daphnia carinata TaxID=120202 RepID=UPI00257ACFE6|nr:uncharacterized protein LOC130704248 [Daphnia carinata]